MTDSKFEKKSERLEIRLSHSKKQAFNQACETQGDTPSGAVRRFIDGYIRRADQDAFKDGLRALGRIGRRKWAPIGAIASLLLIGGYFTGQALRPTPVDGPIVTASTDEFPAINYALFAAYDKNANGVIDLGEIAKNDAHLHRVLNLDGKAGIAPSEFYAKAKMQWSFVKPGTVSTTEDETGNPTATVKQDGDATLVEFDLSDPDNVSIITRKPRKTLTGETDTSGTRFFGLMRYRTTVKTETAELSQRNVHWERGKTRPVLSFSSHNFRERHHSGS
ncbi:hypothetical protein [Fretibacter rubidus]|uniref:hypothetical protein n=1 Tax=Fretibacter rubidus TaxID=570162 RepID=UPI00352A6D6D